VCCVNSHGLLYLFLEKHRVRKSMMLFNILYSSSTGPVSSISISRIITSVLMTVKDCRLRQEAFHTLLRRMRVRGV